MLNVRLQSWQLVCRRLWTLTSPSSDLAGQAVLCRTACRCQNVPLPVFKRYSIKYFTYC